MSQSISRRSLRARLYRRVVDLQALFARRRPRRHGLFFEYPPYQSPSEEFANGLTHGLAALVSLVAGAWLVVAAVRRGEALMTMSCAAFSASLTAVFTMSALSHLIQLPRLRVLFRTLDQACIYLLIAGSFTPYAVRYLIPQHWGWLLAVMWGLALLRGWDKLRGHRVNSVSVVPNVTLGWFPLIAAKPLVATMPPGCLALSVASGACYMLGVLFLVLDGRRRYFHAVWHLLVVAAAACTYAAILIYII